MTYAPVRYCEVCSLPALPDSRLCGDARCDIATSTDSSPPLDPYCEGCGLSMLDHVATVEWDGSDLITFTHIECRYCGLEKP